MGDPLGAESLCGTWVGVRAGGLTLGAETAAMASGCGDWGSLPALS